MDCLNTYRSLSRYLDGFTSADERIDIERHLQECSGCSDRASDYRRMRVALQDLPNRAPSPDLQMRLQILASRERSRRFHEEHWPNIGTSGVNGRCCR